MEENKNEVSLRHRREWREFRDTFLKNAMLEDNAESAKLAKAIADVLKVYQEGERKAWGFSDQEISEALEIAWMQ